MKNVFTAGAALLLTTSIASAGGLDRSGQGIGFIFEEGEAAFGSFALVSPEISSNPEAAAGDTGQNYTSLSFGYKKPVGNGLELSIIVDQPFGADIAYGTGPLAGTEASVTSSAATGILRYMTSENVSVYGGLRLQSLRGEASVPAAGYTLDTETSYGAGYLVGAAYERPEIALRVALTYNSAIDHTLAGEEASPIPGGPVTDFDVTTPQSVNLDFQSGIAADTLLFGSIRWVEWSEFDITPARYAGGSLVDYSEDVTTYTLGLGRRFSDVFSGQFSVSYEESQGGIAPNLGPTDGYISYSVGGEYKVNDQTKVRGGIRYVDIGDAQTQYFAFEDNSAIAVGASVVYTF
ncbi:outer membrane protein transport protein [Yoonia maritima]|uniref:outer membrane protein transport protein n=1 Tax=Yoonia maritima TaxID=1435347 RepID=UPI003735EBCC